MPLIVDAYNVLHTTGILPPDMAGIEVDGLVDLITTSRHGRQRCHIVCDGTPGRGREAASGGGHSARIDIVYSGRGRTADDVIVRMIEDSTHPRTLTIVSSDAAILKAARRRRCRGVKSEAFLQHLVDDRQRSQRAAKPAPKRPSGRLTSEQVGREHARLGLSEEYVRSVEKARREAGAPKPVRKPAPGIVAPTPEAPAEPRRRPRKPAVDPVQAARRMFGLDADEEAAIERDRAGEPVRPRPAPASAKSPKGKAKDASSRPRPYKADRMASELQWFGYSADELDKLAADALPTTPLDQPPAAPAPSTPAESAPPGKSPAKPPPRPRGKPGREARPRGDMLPRDIIEEAQRMLQQSDPDPGPGGA